eukprot:gene909-608_t
MNQPASGTKRRVIEASDDAFVKQSSFHAVFETLMSQNEQILTNQVALANALEVQLPYSGFLKEPVTTAPRNTTNPFSTPNRKVAANCPPTLAKPAPPTGNQ